MKRLLWLSDGVIPTGFSRVAHSIIGHLPEEEYEIHHLAVNYYGDPHQYKHKIYPAVSKGNIYGLNRIHEFKNKSLTGIFILNDLWVVDLYLKKIKEEFKNNIPPIIVYFPVDAENFDEEWFSNFDIVTQAVVYTKFGYNVAKAAYPNHEFKIIPHGVSTDIFYKLGDDKRKIKESLYPKRAEFLDDSFIVLNANRNQPRKRIDVAVEGFGLFSKNKPENVKYYHHAGLQDAGWNILKLAKTFNIDKRIILTNMEANVQRVSDTKLNLIYNATDVGLNTSLGEGWGLPNVEHAATGSVQVVSANSASQELFEDCGLLIPVSQHLYFERILTKGLLVRPEDVADRLQFLYDNRDAMKALSDLCYAKFTSEKYSWEAITKKWDELFSEIFIEKKPVETEKEEVINDEIGPERDDISG